MIMKRIFQSIVVASLLLHVIWFFMPYAWIYIYKGDEADLLSWANYGALVDVNGSIPYLILFAYLIASVGLVLLKKWARTVFLALTISSVALSLVLGFIVSPPLDAAIGYIVALADGSILTIAYLTSLGSEFK